jgi:threonine dehydratase
MDPETITFDYVRRYVDRVVRAPEDALCAAVRGLAAQEHLIAEGAGAAALAALLDGLGVAGRRVAAVVSGSNIDAARLASLISGAPPGPRQ